MLPDLEELEIAGCDSVGSQPMVCEDEVLFPNLRRLHVGPERHVIFGDPQQAPVPNNRLFRFILAHGVC